MQRWYSPATSCPSFQSISKSIQQEKLTVIPFLNKFPKNDGFIDQFKSEDEKSRILNTLLYYLDRVIVNGGNLTRPQPEDETKELWRNHSDIGSLFILTRLRRRKDNKEVSDTVAEVNTALIKLCTKMQKPQPTGDRFNEKMESIGYEQYSTKRNKESVRCWKDVVLIAEKDCQDTMKSYMSQS